MFKEKANDKQLYDIHYLTIKYLIENSQKIQKFFEEYANTENEEDANKSKNRLYSLIGNELGNLEIEYPILIPLGLIFYFENIKINFKKCLIFLLICTYLKNKILKK